ncbi:MAG: hypothetical protein HYY05_01415, partial [Chloroflexi bacterium]|nr:hypothetical protein [Chloroflexota bacterium]
RGQIDEYAYRNMLLRMFQPFGFQMVHTGEPNVRMHSANILMARVGAQVSAGRRAAFEEALLVRPGLRQHNRE